MNAPERPAIERAAIEGAVHIPLALLAPSATNPRRHHTDLAAEQRAWNLAELAESIKKHGVIQPILARPRPGAKPDDGQPLYEIVAGERRWRASQLAGQPSIMAIVRDMSDFEVLELQVIENLQRQDLHPLEEAEGYAKLLRTPTGLQGYANVDELAARLGKSRRYVYNRLTLCKLCPQAREAFYEGQISTSVAQLIAALPHLEQQQSATGDIVRGWGGEPYTFKQTAQYLEQQFMLRLDRAKFDVQAIYTVAGPCGQCSKRSGANPDLFADITSGDMCQDRACFDAKLLEARQVKLDEAEAAGHTVVDGAAARKIIPFNGARAIGHQLLDKACSEFTDSKKPLRELLGKDFKQVILVNAENSDEPIAVAADAVVKKALKARGLLRAEKVPAKHVIGANGTPVMAAPPKPLKPEQIQAAIEHRAADLFGPRAFKQLHEAITSDEQLPILALRLLALERAGDYMSYEACQLLYETRGWKQTGREHGISTDLEARIERADGRELAELLVAMLLVEECSDNVPLKRMEPDCKLRLFAGEYRVDLDKVRDWADAEATAQIKAEQAEREQHAAKAAEEAKAKASTERKAKARSKHADATDAFVAAHKGKATEKEDAPLPLKNGSTLSAEAAWPFPTGVQP